MIQARAVRTSQECDEVRVFDGMAERTGATAPLRGFRLSPNVASSMRDLARRYRVLGDGTFYVVEGNWPPSASSVNLKQRYWASMEVAVAETEKWHRGRRSPDAADDKG